MKKKPASSKKIRDRNAPPRPISAYHTFYKQRFNHLKAHSSASKLSDWNKTISAEWAILSETEKKVLSDQFKVEKARYLELMKEYRKTENYRDFVKLQRKVNKSKSIQKNGSPGTKGSSSMKKADKMNLDDSDYRDQEEDSNGLKIPIFTSGFLEHNKQRETTLRQLKKQVTCLEEETALLSKHVENLETAVTEANSEAARRTDSISDLETELTNLYGHISEALADLPLPDTRVRITPGNVDDYLETVCLLHSTDKHPEFVQRVKKVLADLDIE